jgi:hypothetical protein
MLLLPNGWFAETDAPVVCFRVRLLEPRKYAVCHEPIRHHGHECRVGPISLQAVQLLHTHSLLRVDLSLLRSLEV